MNTHLRDIQTPNLYRFSRHMFRIGRDHLRKEDNINTRWGNSNNFREVTAGAVLKIGRYNCSWAAHFQRYLWLGQHYKDSLSCPLFVKTIVLWSQPKGLFNDVINSVWSFRLQENWRYHSSIGNGTPRMVPTPENVWVLLLVELFIIYSNCFPMLYWVRFITLYDVYICSGIGHQQK